MEQLVAQWRLTLTRYWVDNYRMLKIHTHDDLVNELLTLPRKEWAEISDESGVSLRTLQKIARRETLDPGVSKIERISKCLQRRIKP